MLRAKYAKPGILYKATKDGIVGLLLPHEKIKNPINDDMVFYGINTYHPTKLSVNFYNPDDAIFEADEEEYGILIERIFNVKS